MTGVLIRKEKLSTDSRGDHDVMEAETGMMPLQAWGMPASQEAGSRQDSPLKPSRWAAALLTT